jgi:lysyl-tRNA synthetase class 1
VIETFGITFGLLLNLASVCNPEDKSVLWGFISRYVKDADSKSAPYLDKLVEFAVTYYNDFIKAHKIYLEPTESQKLILEDILSMLSNIHTEISAEEIQEKMYEIGMKAGYENLRDYFKELYQILLGQTEGPRLGSFIKLFGLKETKDLIKEKLNLQHK